MAESKRIAPEGEALGILCALDAELGSLRDYSIGQREHHGLRLWELEIHGRQVLACVGGVGKVPAARAASALIAEGVGRALFVVGVCGGLKRTTSPGDLVHCERAIQIDSAIRETREVLAEPEILGAWATQTGGLTGAFLTADRPVITPWRRLRLGRAFLGTPVADMETAAAAFVAQHSGVPWAALRAVTDGVWWGGSTAFKRHYPTQAGRAADTLPELISGFESI
ncbi:MAG: adenosylhomocysteine nucleosidase [Planctomycetota bacterium]|jgi:adenosylhomocysteine nucleosidase